MPILPQLFNLPLLDFRTVLENYFYMESSSLEPNSGFRKLLLNSNFSDEQGGTDLHARVIFAVPRPLSQTTPILVAELTTECWRDSDFSGSSWAKSARSGQVIDRVLRRAGMGLEPSYREYPDEIGTVGNYAIADAKLLII